MSAGKNQQRGFTLMGALILVAMMGAGLAAYGGIASHAAQREKEAELLFRGKEYRQAIERYYKKERTYPKALTELIEDKRYPTPAHHLRRLYPDPLTGQPDWELVKAPEGGIMGVHSKSEAPPIKSGGFTLADKTFADAPRYADWQFFYKPN